MGPLLRSRQHPCIMFSLTQPPRSGSEPCLRWFRLQQCVPGGGWPWHSGMGLPDPGSFHVYTYIIISSAVFTQHQDPTLSFWLEWLLSVSSVVRTGLTQPLLGKGGHAPSKHHQSHLKVMASSHPDQLTLGSPIYSPKLCGLESRVMIYLVSHTQSTDELISFVHPATENLPSFILRNN